MLDRPLAGLRDRSSRGWGLRGAALLLSLAAGCADTAGADEAPSVDELSAPRPFCELSQPTTPVARVPWRSTFWAAETVQREIRDLASSPALRCSPQGAYLEVYARMTAARDAARCTPGDAMRPADALDARLNDALADAMTRNYLEIARRCAVAGEAVLPDPADPGGLWCEMHRVALRENRDAVRLATASTGLYLSAHLALAVSMLPHVDALWTSTPYGTLASRLGRLGAFKPTFDAFNGFLARNLDTVAGALGDAGLLRGPAFEVAAGLAERAFPSALAFGRIRDLAWARGLELARAMPRGRHPWTVSAPGGTTLAASPSRGAAAWPDDPGVRAQRDALVREARNARELLSSPALGLLGGHNFVSLAPGTAARSACLAR